MGRACLGIVLSATAGCGSDPTRGGEEDVTELDGALGVEVPTCSDPDSSLFDSQTRTLTIAMTAGTPSVLVAVVGGLVSANGYPCVKKTAEGGAQLAASLVKKLVVTGTGASGERVILDLSSGSFGSSILSSTGGITVDLGAGSGDELSIRGSSSVERITAGESGGDVYFELSGDTVADLVAKHVEALTLALSAGNDSFSGRGGTLTATHLAGSTLTSLAPASVAFTVDGGDGDDSLLGGDGDDRLTGGAGNDTLKSHSAPDGADELVGGAGTDKVDYGTRTAAIAAVADGVTSSGSGAAMQGAAATEGDVIAADVEDLVGGSGDDYLVGNDLPNRLTGNAGNDWLSGGPGGDCSVDLDALDGGAGDDRFLQGAAADCADVMTGGAGTDRVDYQQRSTALTLTSEGAGNDGEAGEADNVKPDIEVVLGGSGDDTITGSGVADELHGGPGNDVLSGGAGNDVLIGDSGNDVLNGDAGNDLFLESGSDDAYASGSEPRGGGGDVLNGGTPSTGTTDKADYSQRTGALTITLCTDPAKARGASGLAQAPCTDSDGSGGEGDSVINVQYLSGGSGNDQLTGHTGDDSIEGGSGDDVLSGAGGNDRLFGDAGDDDLYGDAGDDYLDGVAGADSLDGDRSTGSGDGDICIFETGESVTNCEL